jgi:dihydrolipoamide dehydrogenase
MHDVIIIGGGPGGYVCAIRAAQHGLSVALVEKAQLGGTCLNRGCIPTKALAHTAEMVEMSGRASEFGLIMEKAVVDFPKVMSRKDRSVARLRGGVGLLLKRRGVTVLTGKAVLAGSRAVEVTAENGEVTRLEARNIVIATGSEPVTPRIFGYDGDHVLTSEDVLRLKELPRRLLIIGAGVIGCEFASIFRAFGSEVDVVDIMPNILPMVDDDAADLVRATFKKRGIGVHTGVKVASVNVVGDEVEATTADGQVFKADRVVLSIGRRPTTGGVGAADIGVETGSAGEIVVDSRMRTSVAGVWAIGDVTNKMQLAHVASVQGMAVAANIAGHDTIVDYEAVPNVIFTSPEVASVGVSERSAAAAGAAVRVARFPFVGNGKAVTMGEAEGFVKIIADETGKVVGGSVVGPHASDLIAPLGLAVSSRMPAEQVARTIFAHPTLAEAVGEAAEGLFGMAIHI